MDLDEFICPVCHEQAEAFPEGNFNSRCGNCMSLVPNEDVKNNQPLSAEPEDQE